MTRFIDMHVLQTVPFANLNRDDLGSPKSLTFGGASRTRVSSQCWKRATREHMEDALGASAETAVRTRRPVQILRDRLTAKGWDAAEASHAARVVFGPFLDTKDKGKAKDGEEPAEATTNVMVFLTGSQFDDLADLAQTHKADLLAVTPGDKKGDTPAFKKAVRTPIETVIKDPRGMVALLGRMLAELPGANVDSAVQVAHAFTVHENASEIDYFTAVDDVAEDGDRGAGHLGTAEFTSGTFYRYVTVDLATLEENCGDKAVAHALAAHFLTSFALSLPSGKATSSAASTRPDLIVTQVREDAPLSWASAFESPIRANSGYLTPAVTALAEHVSAVRDAYGDTPTWGGHLSTVTGADTSAFGERTTGGVSGLVGATLTAAAGQVSEAA